VSEPRRRVLDASALLALLHGEEGSEVVEPLLEQAAISALNWSEVHHQALSHGADVAGLRGDLEALGLEIVPFDADDAERAAELWTGTRKAGLSLGDRACIALAWRRGGPADTSDRPCTRLRLGVEIETIR
jgi:ribonuclease VapC